MNGIQKEIDENGVAPLDVTEVATRMSANSLDTHIVSITVVSFKAAVYLMEGLVEGSLRLQVVAGEPYPPS